MPCFNFKVQRERELFGLNCPPHDSKLSEIDYDERSQEEQHRNNFLQTFCQKNVKSWRFRKSGYAKAKVPLSKNLRRGNRGFRRSGGSAFAETPKFVSVQCDRALSVYAVRTYIYVRVSTHCLHVDSITTRVGTCTLHVGTCTFEICRNPPSANSCARP